jgi:hypothetical protein
MTSSPQSPSGPPTPTAELLQARFRIARESLIWKLDGLSEREARLPRTPTGVSLLGIVKHCAWTEYGYFGDCMGRTTDAITEIPTLTEEDFEEDPQIDWYAKPEESMASIVDLYERVAVFADEAMLSLPPDTPVTVPWWREERRHTTLELISIHTLCDIVRHAGHADIIREAMDGSIGLAKTLPNVDPGFDWPTYVAKVTAIADEF